MTDKNEMLSDAALDQVSGGKQFQVDVKWQPTAVTHSKASGRIVSESRSS